MKFISLIDTNNQNIFTIDADSFILRIEIDNIPIESRIKPFMASILYELFKDHPNPFDFRADVGFLNVEVRYNLLL